MSKRLLPNPDRLTMVVNGRTYAGTAGVPMDGVPDFDAAILEANGWQLLDPAAAELDTRALLAANNLSDLASAATARSSLGLGTAATTATTAYATSAQGAKADTALQPATAVSVTSVKSSAGAGTVGGAGITAAEYGDGRTHQTVLTIAATTVLPAITGNAAQGVGTLLYTFPAGSQIVESAYMSVGITQSEGHINADTPDVGIGTVVATGGVSVLDGTGTFENIVTGQTAANCTGTASVATALPTGNVPLIIAAGDAHTLYLNAAATWTLGGDAAAKLTGTVTINWRTMA